MSIDKIIYHNKKITLKHDILFILKAGIVIHKGFLVKAFLTNKINFNNSFISILIKKKNKTKKSKLIFYVIIKNTKIDKQYFNFQLLIKKNEIIKLTKIYYNSIKVYKTILSNNKIKLILTILKINKNKFKKNTLIQKKAKEFKKNKKKYYKNN